MNSYKALVNKYFDEKSDLVISNRDASHAAVLVSTLFNRAEKNVLLLCEELNGDFYDSPLIMSSILEAIDRNVEVKILVQRPPKANKLLDALKAREGDNRVEIRVCAPGSEGAELPVNFAVMDSQAYRVETDIHAAKAFACANDLETAKVMVDRFNYLFRLADGKTAAILD